MFIGPFGIRLVFWLGPTVPRPAPLELLRAFTQVQVTNDANAADGFQLTFACGRAPFGGYTLVDSPLLRPRIRVILGVILGAAPEPLVDGVISHVQFSPGSGTSPATLTVTGRDLTTLMDLEERNGSYENQSDSIQVAQVLSGYARYGVTPAPVPTMNTPLSTERVPRQHETDLRFIQRLARNNGYVFYLEPLTLGTTRAYWGPAIRTGIPQPALSVDVDAATNVTSLSFTEDALAAVGTQGVFVEPFSHTSIPIPALPSLRVPPLAASPATPWRTTLERETANRNAADAGQAALASTMNTPDAVTADGEVDTARYGSVLRARGLVGLRGAGVMHDGLWYVSRVTHAITRTTYTQRFSLGREGTGTTTPIVRP